MKLIAALATVGILVSMSAPVRAATSSNDSSFVKAAQSDLLGEYALAALGRGKAESPQVKSFASELATQADKANIFIKKFEKSHDLPVNTTPNFRADAQYGELRQMPKSTFDRRLTEDLNVDAQMSLSDFQSEAQDGSDPALRAFAKEQASLLQRDSNEAEKLIH
jgi:putative membrane protein